MGKFVGKQNGLYTRFGCSGLFCDAFFRQLGVVAGRNHTSSDDMWMMGEVYAPAGNRADRCARNFSLA